MLAPLSGRRVLVTRPREQADSLARLLTEAGAVPIELPSIELGQPPSWEAVDRAIADLAAYDWIVFTSANGVRSFVHRLGEPGQSAEALAGVRIAAIGPATAAALREAGLAVSFIPGEYVAEAVAEGLIERGVAGKRILLARAAEVRPALAKLLRKAGARVDEVAAYATRPVPETGARLAALLAAGLDAITFTSASTVRGAVAALADGADGGLPDDLASGPRRGDPTWSPRGGGRGDHVGSPLRGMAGRLANDSSVVVACIGPITAAAARELGLRVDVIATEYTAAGLVRALEEHYGRPDTAV